MSTEKRAPGRRRAPAADERRRDPERTKALIIEAAAEEFSAKGFAGARVSEIAARAGVNKQLIAYYFDGKEGLYREVGRRWLAYEAETFPADMPFAEQVKGYVRASLERGGRLLAWEGLADTGEDDESGEERDVQLRREVEAVRERQRAGELDARLDPAAFILITMGAANALAVYPQLARGLFGADGGSPEVVEHYAEQLAQMIGGLGGGQRG